MGAGKIKSIENGLVFFSLGITGTLLGLLGILSTFVSHLRVLRLEIS
jgi:hypothetical protein